MQSELSLMTAPVQATTVLEDTDCRRVVTLEIIVQVGNGSPWFLLAGLVAPTLAMCLVLPDQALPTL